MKVSWALLTYNRFSIVEHSLFHNYTSRGYPIDELIWVDNGSNDRMGHALPLRPKVGVLNETNQGVARGYNQAMAMCRGEWIVITGCDRLLPNRWLETMMGLADTAGNSVGIVSCYTKPLSQVPERVRGKSIGNFEKYAVVPCMPMEARIFRRSLLKDVGYFNEGFGLYGHEDRAWAYTAERVCKENGLLSVTLDGWTADHLGNEGITPFNGKEDQEYHAMKQREANDPQKQELMRSLEKQGWPAYHPF